MRVQGGCQSQQDALDTAEESDPIDHQDSPRGTPDGARHSILAMRSA
jgi:hypothetical protein